MNLSQREKGILMCIAQGLVDKEISKKFGISQHTVHAHIHSILNKLNAHTRAQAVAIHYEGILNKIREAGLI